MEWEGSEGSLCYFSGGLIIVGVVLVIRYFTTGQVSGRKDSSPYEIRSEPLQILRERYAKGEIDTKEFEERKKMLESGQ